MDLSDKEAETLPAIDSSNSVTELSHNMEEEEANSLSSLARRVEEKEKKKVTSSNKEEESRLKDLHPYTCTLTLKDLDSCVILEKAAYNNSSDCATREKLKYRLSKCGELCLGLFCTVLPDSGFEAETLATSLPVETGRRNKAVSVLLGHVIASKIRDTRATDESTCVPEDWESQNPEPSKLGHQEDGRTIILHSIAVLPGFRCRGIGNTLVMALTHQVRGTGIADRLALAVRADNMAWYEERGFMNVGPSSVTFGDGEWYDMVRKKLKSRKRKC